MAWQMSLPVVLYCDASWRNRLGGMAVIAPEWCACLRGSLLQSGARIERNIGLNGYIAFWGACACANSTEAERRAIAMAYLLADDILHARRNAKISIVSDCISAIDQIMCDTHLSIHILEPLRSLWRLNRSSVFFEKVKGHKGNPGNEAADKWAGRARYILEQQVLHG